MFTQQQQYLRAHPTLKVTCNHINVVHKKVLIFLPWNEVESKYKVSQNGHTTVKYKNLVNGYFPHLIRERVNICLFTLYVRSVHIRLAWTPVSAPHPSSTHEVIHEWQQRTPPGVLVTAPSGPSQCSPSHPQSVPRVPVWRCLMSTYEQTFNCQVALPPDHADQAGFCHCRSNPGASKGGLGFPK